MSGYGEWLDHLAADDFAAYYAFFLADVDVDSDQEQDREDDEYGYEAKQPGRHDGTVPDA